MKSEWNGKAIHSYGESNSRGVSILFQKDLDVELCENEIKIDNEGRYISLNIKIYENMYCITNIYAPNDKHKRNSFYKNLNKHIIDFSKGINIIAGDWNEIQHADDRKSRKNRFKNNSNLKQLKQSLNLIDTWLYKNKNKKQFTWRRKNNSTEASRIDYILVTKDLISKINFSDIFC